MIEVTPY